MGRFRQRVIILLLGVTWWTRKGRDLCMMFLWVEWQYWASFGAFDTTDMVIVISHEWFSLVGISAVPGTGIRQLASFHQEFSGGWRKDEARPLWLVLRFSLSDLTVMVIRRTSDNECHTLYISLVKYSSRWHYHWLEVGFSDRFFVSGWPTIQDVICHVVTGC